MGDCAYKYPFNGASDARKPQQYSSLKAILCLSHNKKVFTDFANFKQSFNDPISLFSTQESLECRRH